MLTLIPLRVKAKAWVQAWHFGGVTMPLRPCLLIVTWVPGVFDTQGLWAVHTPQELHDCLRGRTMVREAAKSQTDRLRLRMPQSRSGFPTAGSCCKWTLGQICRTDFFHPSMEWGGPALWFLSVWNRGSFPVAFQGPQMKHPSLETRGNQEALLDQVSPSQGSGQPCLITLMFFESLVAANEGWLLETYGIQKRCSCEWIWTWVAVQASAQLSF